MIWHQEERPGDQHTHHEGKEGHERRQHDVVGAGGRAVVGPRSTHQPHQCGPQSRDKEAAGCANQQSSTIKLGHVDGAPVKEVICVPGALLEIVAGHGHVHVSTPSKGSEIFLVESDGLVTPFSTEADLADRPDAAILVVLLRFADRSCQEIQDDAKRAEDENQQRAIRERANVVPGDVEVGIAKKTRPFELLVIHRRVVPHLRHVGIHEARHGRAELVDPGKAHDEAEENPQLFSLVVDLESAISGRYTVEAGHEEHQADAEVDEQECLAGSRNHGLRENRRRVVRGFAHRLHGLEGHVKILPLKGNRNLENDDCDEGGGTQQELHVVQEVPNVSQLQFHLHGIDHRSQADEP
mmetsp:Transcript_63767/g.149482  ORF Transcript_63767/g.149482 Transcript_63767/m.149482 type:complete len:354 (+) Transcript_63767:300-1361(+)